MAVTEGRTFVVGLDDSPDGRAALRWAMQEATAHGAALRAVTAFEPPQAFAYAYDVAPLSPEQAMAQVREEAQRIVDSVAADLADQTPPVRVQTVAGSPGPVLVEQAWDAELLIVGHRGRGAVASTLLGSVGLHCVLHASCPVAVVRPQASTDG